LSFALSLLINYFYFGAFGEGLRYAYKQKQIQITDSRLTIYIYYIVYVLILNTLTNDFFNTFSLSFTLNFTLFFDYSTGFYYPTGTLDY
jgi:hypothetical protein